MKTKLLKVYAWAYVALFVAAIIYCFYLTYQIECNIEAISQGLDEMIALTDSTKALIGVPEDTVIHHLPPHMDSLFDSIDAKLDSAIALTEKR